MSWIGHEKPKGLATCVKGRSHNLSFSTIHNMHFGQVCIGPPGEPSSYLENSWSTNAMFGISINYRSKLSGSSRYKMIGARMCKRIPIMERGIDLLTGISTWMWPPCPSYTLQVGGISQIKCTFPTILSCIFSKSSDSVIVNWRIRWVIGRFYFVKIARTG